MQGLTCKAPTDTDISIVLKEFTVDFLLKGFNSLVRSLHRQIVSEAAMDIDKSYLFWLVTYFLKFATQIEMGVEKVRDVLSFEFVAYLTADGAMLCEELLLAQRQDSQLLKTCVRRTHLVRNQLFFLNAMRPDAMIDSHLTLYSLGAIHTDQDLRYLLLFNLIISNANCFE